MKSTLKLLPMALLVLLPLSSFAGGNSGGGGGGICLTNNKCMTLAQAGLRIKEITEERNPLLTDDVLTELDKVITLLPKELEISSDKVIGSRNDIQEVQIDNQKKLKSFIKEYQQILTDNGNSNLAKNVELMAFTSVDYNSKVTYLIREKFEALNVRGQVLILLHEYLIRSKNFSVKDALFFDGVVLDYLTAIEANKRPDATGIIKVIEKLNAKDITVINAYAFNEALLGRPLEIQDFDIKNYGTTSYVSFSYNQILKLSKAYPKMKFVKDIIAIDLVNRDRDAYVIAFLNLIAKDLMKNRQVVLNKGYVEAFLAKYKINPSWYSVCESYSDKSRWILANEATSNLAQPYKVDCTLDPENVNLFMEYPVYPDIYERLFKNINGHEMNFEKDFVCQFEMNRKGTSTPEISCK